MRSRRSRGNVSSEERTLPSYKTQADPNAVRAYLSRAFSGDAGALIPLKGGEFSQAYRFEARGEQWVVRVNARRSGFDKDAFAHRRFASQRLPIPATALIGEMSDGVFASITTWIDGTTMDQLSGAELARLMPAFLRTLDALHGSETGLARGFGHWDATGQAPHTSWHDHLIDTLNRRRDSYRRTFDASHPVWSLFRTAEARIEAFVPACPEAHDLVHGDIGFDNTLVRDGRVVGVIDWEGSAYGDRLSDIAWLGLWLEGSDIVEGFLRHCRETGADVDQYHERITCYALLYGLDAVRFYASAGRDADAAWARKRVEAFLG
jgi:hygromycin-B 4-O-kinase